MTKSTATSTKKPSLHLLDPECAGIDVGSEELYVCVAKNDSEQDVKSFLTFTRDLKHMIHWLKENKVKSVAMESTGVYWIVPYEMLDKAGFEVVLVNAQYFKNVPGRKTDVQDCQWIQQLHSYRLLRGSFRPSDQIVELRSYVRQRSRLFELAATQVQLMHKALTQMNIQLNHTMSDITGVSGLNIIRAIVEGKRDAKELADLSVGLCRKNIHKIVKALEGNYRKEHVFALEQAYTGYEFFHTQITRCEEAIKETLSSMQAYEIKCNAPKKQERKKTKSNRSPYYFDAAQMLKRATKADLTTIPGIDANIAMKIVSEVGTDMSQWANAKAFASWLGLTPGNKISGGKVLNSRTKPTKSRAAGALRMAAMTLRRSQTALGAFFRRMRARLGAPKAITATAHKLAKILYKMMLTGEDYREAGENYYEEQYTKRVVLNLNKRAKELGYELIKSA